MILQDATQLDIGQVIWSHIYVRIKMNQKWKGLYIKFGILPEYFLHMSMNYIVH